MKPETKATWKKIALKIFLIATLGALLGIVTIPNKEFGTENIPLLASRPAELGLLITLLLGFMKIASKNPTGWGLLSTYFYLNCYRHPGLIAAWLYLLLSLWALFVLLRWKNLVKPIINTSWNTNSNGSE